MDFSNHPLNRNNDNVVNKLTNNDKDNVARSESQVNFIADQLVGLFNNPGGRLYYCKVGWKLTEAQIWGNYETAAKSGREPVKYFSWLCSRDMLKSQ